MKSTECGKCVALGIFTMLVATALLGVSSSYAAEGDDLAKSVDKTLSTVRRHTVTEPSRAEQEWLQAAEDLGKLETVAPDHPKLDSLRATSEKMREALAKRLGRPVGEQAVAAETEMARPSKSGDSTEASQSELPYSVTSRLKRIGASLDAVDVALAKGRLQTAIRKLDDAQRQMNEIDDRYASKIPDDEPQVKAARDRLGSATSEVAKHEQAAAEAAEADAAAEKARQTQSQQWIDRLSPFKDYKSEKYLRIGADFNNASEEQQAETRAAYAEAKRLLATYHETAFPYGKTFELRNLEASLIGTMMMWDATQERDKREAASAEWVAKLRPFVDVGAGSPKYLVVSVTLNEDDIRERDDLLQQAQAVWTDYEKATFPLGKSDKLQELEAAMKQALAQMPEALRKSRALVSNDLERELDRVLAHLEQETGWKDDPLKKPNLLMQRDLEPLQKAVERYAQTVASDDAKVRELRSKLQEIENRDQANRAMRAKRTFMDFDRFVGEDADRLRARVQQLVKEHDSGAVVLRVTLPARNWKEQDFVEWTDTTRTAVRHRTTRSMTTQAAARSANGKVYLHGVHLASDLGSDGQWGPLYGHVMWSDWMAEDNVEKRPPNE